MRRCTALMLVVVMLVSAVGGVSIFANDEKTEVYNYGYFQTFSNADTVPAEYAASHASVSAAIGGEDVDIVHKKYVRYLSNTPTSGGWNNNNLTFANADASLQTGMSGYKEGTITEIQFDIKGTNLAATSANGKYSYMQFRINDGVSSYCPTIEGGDVRLRTPSDGAIAAILGKVSGVSITGTTPWYTIKFVFEDIKYTLDGDATQYKGRILRDMYVNGTQVLDEERKTLPTTGLKLAVNDSTTAERESTNPYVWGAMPTKAVNGYSKKDCGDKFVSINFMPRNTKTTDTDLSVDIDEVSVISYDKATEKVTDRTELRYYLDLAQKLYLEKQALPETNTTQLAELKTMIDNGLSIYETKTSSQTQMDNSVKALKNASKVFAEPIISVYENDFNGLDKQNEFDEGTKDYRLNNINKYGYDSTFGIEDYYVGPIGSNPKIFYELATPIMRDDSSKNLYLELECDMMPTAIDDRGGEALGSVVLSHAEGTTYKYFAGFEFYNNTSKPDRHGKIAPFYAHGSGFENYELNKWYRLKLVAALNDNGTLENLGVVDFYLNGEKKGTGNVVTRTEGSEIDRISHIRFYATGNARFNVDNVTVKTYKAENVPVEKGGLIGAIRDFESEFAGYESSADQKKLIDDAKAIYLKADATEEEVAAGVAYVDTAVNKAMGYSVNISENFGTPNTSFFNSVTDGEQNAASDSTYGIDGMLNITGTEAVKNLDAVTMGTDKFVSVYFDAKSASGFNTTLGNESADSFSGSDLWQQIRYDIDCKNSTAAIYVNGQLKDSKTLSGAEISQLKLTGSGISIDNFMVTSADTAEGMPVNRGGLVNSIRKCDLIAEGLGDAEKAGLNKVLSDSKLVYESRKPSAEKVDEAATRLEAFIANVTSQAPVSGATPIFIPGMAKDMEDVIVKFNLHYGAQEGDILYNELFFNGQSEKDFSDVKFLDDNGNEIYSHVESYGNYDFIQDSTLPINVPVFHTTDGKMVGNEDGYIAMCSDNVNWVHLTDAEGNKYKGEIMFVDRNNNIYYADNAGEDMGVYKLRASENYSAKYWVINNSDAYEQGVVSDCDWSSFVQDDDGYIYAGRYITEWCGAMLYVSDETGENFKIVDYRPDKQHVHSIAVDKNIYPNRVIVTYDDSSRNPLIQVTYDKGGYEEIKDNSLYSYPDCKPRNQWSEDTAIKKDIAQCNEDAKRVFEHAQKHFKQVPSPFAASDYMNYFGVIDDSEDKFYTAENGKRYTTEDNVFALGGGEANILGGPGLFKTTNIMDPAQYKQILNVPQGSRKMADVPGGIVWGGCSGRLIHNPQLAISYDNAETWNTIYNEGYNYSGGAGNGAIRYISDLFVPMGATEEQIIMTGFGSNGMRAKFGKNYHYGYTNVKLSNLPKEGKKIYVVLDKSNDAPIKYTYSDYNNTDAIKASRVYNGESDELVFPTVSEGANTYIYSFNAATAAKTAIEAKLVGTDNFTGEKVVLDLVFRTDSGDVYNAKTDELIGNSEKLKSGEFNARVVLNKTEGKAVVCVDGQDVGTTDMQTDYKKILRLGLSNPDLTASASQNAFSSSDYTTPSPGEPVEISYSEVLCSESLATKGQFAINSINYTKDGSPVTEIEEGVVIESVELKKLDASIEGAVLVVALYNEDTLYAAKLIDVVDTGVYPVNINVNKTGLTSKVFMFKDMATLTPISIGGVATYRLDGDANGEKVSRIHISNNMPYVGKAVSSAPEYVDNDIFKGDLKPVFRLKLNEGTGRTIKEEISGRTAEIVGDDYEWIEDAKIPLGSTMPQKIRSNTALRLNNSYVNLGTFDELKNLDEWTLVFWLNQEIEGRIENASTEPAWHQSLSHAIYDVAYKYDKNRRNVILECGNLKLNLRRRNLAFGGSDGAGKNILLNAAATHCDAYNMYVVTIKNIGGQHYAMAYADESESDSAGKVEEPVSAKGATFGDGNLYLGTSNPTGDYGSCELGLADIMIFDRALTYSERLMIYNGYNQIGYGNASIPVSAD